MKVELKFNTKEILSKTSDFKEILTNYMAADIETLIKSGGRTPVRGGHMKAGVRHKRSQDGYVVEATEDYSAVQEAGTRRGARPFTNYTTPGTGKGWWSGSISSIVGRIEYYADQANKRSRL